MSPTHYPLIQQTVTTNQAPTSVAGGAESMEKRNDNSNPQQGTGGLRSLSGSVSAEARSESSSFAALAPSGPATHAGEIPRRPLAIPPFKKDNRKLFVGGLPSDVTDSEFREFFQQFGELVESVVMFDYETLRSRGFGFVTFKDPEVARHLLTLGCDNKNSNETKTGRIQMRDKLIEIKAAEPKEGRGNHRFGRKNNAPVTAKMVGPAYHVPAQPVCFYGDAVTAIYPMIPPYCAPGVIPGYMAPQGYFAPEAPMVQASPYTPIYNMNDYHPVEPGYSGSAGMAPYTFFPIVPPQPSIYVGASVMQPAAPGIPSKLDETAT